MNKAYCVDCIHFGAKRNKDGSITGETMCFRWNALHTCWQSCDSFLEAKTFDPDQLKDRIFEEIEKKFKAGSYQSGTYHFYSVLYETWQSLKSKPVKEYLK